MLSKLSQGITGIFTKAKLDQAALGALEELLIEADVGAKAAAELVQALSKHRFDKDISAQEVKEFLAGEIAKILAPLTVSLLLPPLTGGDKEGGGLPHLTSPASGGGTIVILVVGTNGSGKTTTIGKLASQFKQEGKKVMLAAADTFRAAAVEQLQEWGKRSDITVVTGAPNSDPASVAFRAYEEARAAGADILLIDTAGRLANKSDLMAELQKICKTLKKIDERAPHCVVQVLDATIGQNTVAQVKTFKEMVKVTGLIVTKLDGTAKGGVLVALAKQCALPIHYIGIGEGVGDLKRFDAGDFAINLLTY